MTNADPDFATLRTGALTTAPDRSPPNVTAQTTLGGKAALDFSNSGYGTGAPFNGPNDATHAAFGYNATANYEIQLSGFINIVENGTYTFGTTSDDGSVIFIDNNPTPVVNNNFYQGFTRRTGTIALTPGIHTIVIGYYQGGGGQGLLVDFTSPSGALHPHPAEQRMLLFQSTTYLTASPRPIPTMSSSTPTRPSTSPIRSARLLAT